MSAGGFCACALTVAKIKGGGKPMKAATRSLVAPWAFYQSFVNLELAGVLGEMKLSVYDTVA